MANLYLTEQVSILTKTGDRLIVREGVSRVRFAGGVQGSGGPVHAVPCQQQDAERG